MRAETEQSSIFVIISENMSAENKNKKQIKLGQGKEDQELQKTRDPTALATRECSIGPPIRKKGLRRMVIFFNILINQAEYSPSIVGSSEFT